MKKKTKIGAIILVFLLVVGFAVYKGVNFVKTVVIPELEEEKILDDPDLACLTLSISHGCATENYNVTELEKYLKERVLTKISIAETKEIIKREEEKILQKRREDVQWDANAHKENLKKQKKECDKGMQRALNDAKKNRNIVVQYTCRGSSGLDIIDYLDKILSILKKIENEK